MNRSMGQMWEVTERELEDTEGGLAILGILAFGFIMIVCLSPSPPDVRKQVDASCK